MSSATKRRRPRGRTATYSQSESDRVMNPDLFLREVHFARKTSSGERVTQESALALSAYWACLNNLSQDVAKIPLELRRKREDRGSDEATEHVVWALLKLRPNPLMGPFVFRQTMQHRRLAWGNAYAEIVRNGLGEPVELWPVHPLRITPKMADDGRTLEYEYRPDGDVLVRTIEARDLFHLRGMGSGLEGLSVLKAGAESLGMALAAQRHAGAFYGEGMAKRLVAVAKNVMSPKSREEFRKRLKGDAENDPVGARKLPFLEGDIDLKEIGIPPEDAQFLESRQFAVPDVARWFRMSLAKLQHEGGSKGWSTLEALNRDYWTDALQPLAVEWEDEARLKLLNELEQGARALYFKHRFQALLRADYQQRWAGYQIALDRGVMSRNEVRELEDMNPMERADGTLDPAGDVYTAQAQNVPVQTTQPGQAPAKAAADGDAEAVVSRLFRMTAERLVRVEMNAARRQAKQHARSAEDFRAWAAEFAAKHAVTVAGAFEPLILALGVEPKPDAVMECARAAGPITLDSGESQRAESLAASMLALAGVRCRG